MIRATTGERIHIAVVRYANVSHLGMRHSMNYAPIHHGATADAGSCREVKKVPDVCGRTPPRFTECRGIDIGIEAHGNAERLSDRSRQVAIPPRQFRR